MNSFEDNGELAINGVGASKPCSRDPASWHAGTDATAPHITLLKSTIKTKSVAPSEVLNAILKLEKAKLPVSSSEYPLKALAAEGDHHATVLPYR